MNTEIIGADGQSKKAETTQGYELPHITSGFGVVSVNGQHEEVRVFIKPQDVSLEIGGYRQKVTGRLLISLDIAQANALGIVVESFLPYVDVPVPVLKTNIPRPSDGMKNKKVEIVDETGLVVKAFFKWISLRNKIIIRDIVSGNILELAVTVVEEEKSQDGKEVLFYLDNGNIYRMSLLEESNSTAI